MKRTNFWDWGFETPTISAFLCLTLLFSVAADGILASQDASKVRKDIPSRPNEESSTSRMTPEETKPFFRITDEQKAKLIEEMKNVQLGDSRQRVEALLGKPWSDHLVRTKETNKPTGRSVTYYAVKSSKTMVNEKTDEFVLLSFDNSDKLQKVISHLPGVANRP
jgi:hypothetical protein